jgi:hypothetical protein
MSVDTMDAVKAASSDCLKDVWKAVQKVCCSAVLSVDCLADLKVGHSAGEMAQQWVVYSVALLVDQWVAVVGSCSGDTMAAM